MLSVVRAMEAGATTMKSVIDATGLSRLKIERALNALEKQKLLVRDGQGFRPTGLPKTAQPARQCGSCNACCDILEVAGVEKPVNQLCRHWQAGTGCTIYDRRPQMCRSFVWHFYQTEDYIGHFDVVHAHDWLASNAMVWIKQGRPDHRAVLTMHSTEYGRSGNAFWLGPSERIRDHERHGTYCADRVIAVSHALKGELMWLYNLPDWKCWAIYNGVPVHKFDGFLDPGAVKRKYDIGPLDPTVLFGGRLCLQKAPDLLLEAVPGLLRHYPRAKFVFAGDGHMRGVLENRACQLGVSHATRFLG